MKRLVFTLGMLVASMTLAVQAPGPSWCTSRTNSFCTYAWDRFNGCCYATYTQSGAHCPKICL
jgi:hypothetical protein